MTAPRRRWSRFSLRTLFVVVTVLAVPLGWIAWQLNWIRQRHAFLADKRITGRLRDETAMPPWPLKMFGEIALVKIWVAEGESLELVLRGESLFPEAIFSKGFQVHTRSGADQPATH